MIVVDHVRHSAKAFAITVEHLLALRRAGHMCPGRLIAASWPEMVPTRNSAHLRPLEARGPV